MGRTLRAVVCAALAVAVSLTGAAAADSFVDEQYMASRPPVANEPGWISGFYDDSISDVRTGSLLFGAAGRWQDGWDAAALCTSMVDPACASFNHFDFTAFLPACSDSVVTDCISSMEAITDAGTVRATYIREFPERGANDFTGNPSIGLPNGESPSLWKLDGISHPGGDLYLASAALTGWVDNGLTAQLRMSIFPVSVISGTGPNTVRSGVAALPNGRFGRSARGENVYLFRGDNEVVQRQPFPSGVKFRITVRVRNALTGWLHGRVQQPDIQIETGSYGQQVSVTALPTVVPILDHWSKFIELPAQLQSILRGQGRPTGAFSFGTSQDGDWEKVSTSYQANGSANEQTLQQFILFNQAAGDRAAANKSAWTIRTMDPGEMGSAQRCLRDSSQLAGVVSTNATAYLGGPPTFDQATQTLNYRVASPHFGRTGTVDIGEYALAIRLDIARCLYGFVDAPISATVSVLSADGTQQVATTTVNQKDGWLYLTASGFTYSSPTVQVKLTQATPAITVKPAQPKPIIKKTIMCTKGKQSKKVTGTKCPTGWKKQ